jgi:hypothetical protein
MLHEPQSQFKLCGREDKKNLFPYQESNPDYPACIRHYNSEAILAILLEYIIHNSIL